MTDRESEKLDLEVRRLRQELGAPGRLLRLLPVLTGLVAISGLWFGVMKFLSEETLNRQIRWEAQTRSDIQELLAFPHSEESTVARATFLLHDLLNLQAHLRPPEDQITGTLIDLVQNDCDFDNRRHVDLDIALLSEWPMYVARLRSDSDLQTFMVYEYFQALRHLHDADSTYIESLQYVPGSGYIVGPGGYTTEDHYLHFDSLVRGFSLHVSLLDPSSSTYASAIESFRQAVKNDALTSTLFPQE